MENFLGSVFSCLGNVRERFYEVGDRLQRLMAVAALIISVALFPARLVLKVLQIAEQAGALLVQAFVVMMHVALGLTVIFFVISGAVRTLLHPLF
jgi:hypothetical protein